MCQAGKAIVCYLLSHYIFLQSSSLDACLCLSYVVASLRFVGFADAVKQLKPLLKEEPKRLSRWRSLPRLDCLVPNVGRSIAPAKVVPLLCWFVLSPGNHSRPWSTGNALEWPSKRRIRALNELSAFMPASTIQNRLKSHHVHGPPLVIVECLVDLPANGRPVRAWDQGCDWMELTSL